MMQIQSMTREDKLKMYLKLSKKELAEMLINCNDIIEARPIQVVTLTCEHNWQLAFGGPGSGFTCTKCGKWDQGTISPFFSPYYGSVCRNIG